MKCSNIVAVTAGFFCVFAAHAGSAWANAGFGAGQSLDVKEFLSEARANKVPAVPNPMIILAGFAAGNDPQAPVEWVSISGGKFMMGADDGSDLFEDAWPVHEVSIKTFEMSRTLVTVEQYAECVNNGKCTKPDTGGFCNWGRQGRQRHPVNCMDWEQADQYAKFKGARLPSEAEWEYAATSGGRNQKYPWGNEDATCERAVMYGDCGPGCGNWGTMPVCSKPAGNTAQGLCDMAGNVWQWVQDKYQDSYDNAPIDGSAFVTGSYRVVRGGSWNDLARLLRSARRSFDDPGDRRSDLGFRLVRVRRD